MIYTVTFNPSIDYIVNMSSFKSGATNRSTGEEYYVGGKGINVSAVLKALGVESVALGFVAGFTGEEIIKSVNEMGIKEDFIKLKNGTSRINIKIKSTDETEINGQGPEITEDEINILYKKLDAISDGDTIILSGSIPATLPKTIYGDILKRLSHKNVNFVVDATGDLLLESLKYKPFLVKPNNFELGDIFGINITTDDYDSVIKYAKVLKDKGAKNVLVSLAENGSVLIDESGNIHKFGVADIKVINSVGAGDSMLAGFIAGFMEKSDFDYALKLGTACGSATASLMGLATKEQIDKILQII